MAQRGRPASGEDELRDRVLTTKINRKEGKSWDLLAKAMVTSGPPPRDADVIRWLAEQECKRRGIPWPMSDTIEVPAPTPKAARRR